MAPPLYFIISSCRPQAISDKSCLKRLNFSITSAIGNILSVSWGSICVSQAPPNLFGTNYFIIIKKRIGIHFQFVFLAKVSLLDFLYKESPRSYIPGILNAPGSAPCAACGLYT